MNRVVNPEIGKRYITNLSRLHIVEITGLKGDYVKCDEYETENYQNSTELMKIKEDYIVHKSLLFEEPKVWSDIPSNYLLDHILGKINYKTMIYKKLEKLKFDRFDIEYYKELGDELRKQSFSEMLKAVLPKCNFKQLCILRNLFGEVYFMVERITELNVYKEHKGELTEEQLLALEENLQLYKECYAKADDVKYRYCGLEWRRKNSICDLYHYLYGLNSILTDNKFYHMNLFPCTQGNLSSYNALYFSQKKFDPNSSLDLFIENINKTETLSGEDNSFNVIIEYLMNEGLGEEEHHDKLEVPDFINPDYDNKRYLTRSVKNNWFHYLIYISGYELKELYDTKINKKHRNKPVWSYILNENMDTKYYLLIK